MEERITLEQAGQFGIEAADELGHPFDPAIGNWNESWFFDWFAEDGGRAGHCRLARVPNQGRAYFWLFLYDGERWAAIEEPRLDLARLGELVSYSGFGLEFAYAPQAALRTGSLRCSGFGRVLSGPGAGSVVPMRVELEFAAVGPAHSVGQGKVAGHRAEGYSASRFEQPIAVECDQSLGERRQRFAGRGERDHSWGPRFWNMQWTFFVAHGENLRAQCARVMLGGGIPEFHVGYIARGGATENLAEARVELDFDDASITKHVRGQIELTGADGGRVRGRIESLTGAEIDISHCFEPPRHSIYRRNLIRFTPDGGEPCLGWLESNRFVER
jgi:hypothetical protein